MMRRGLMPSALVLLLMMSHGLKLDSQVYKLSEVVEELNSKGVKTKDESCNVSSLCNSRECLRSVARVCVNNGKLAINYRILDCQPSNKNCNYTRPANCSLFKDVGSRIEFCVNKDLVKVPDSMEPAPQSKWTRTEKGPESTEKKAEGQELFRFTWVLTENGLVSTEGAVIKKYHDFQDIASYACDSNSGPVDIAFTLNGDTDFCKHFSCNDSSPYYCKVDNSKLSLNSMIGGAWVKSFCYGFFDAWATPKSSSLPEDSKTVSEQDISSCSKSQFIVRDSELRSDLKDCPLKDIKICSVRLCKVFSVNSVVSIENIDEIVVPGSSLYLVYVLGASNQVFPMEVHNKNSAQEQCGVKCYICGQTQIELCLSVLSFIMVIMISLVAILVLKLYNKRHRYTSCLESVDERPSAERLLPHRYPRRLSGGESRDIGSNLERVQIDQISEHAEELNSVLKTLNSSPERIDSRSQELEPMELAEVKWFGGASLSDSRSCEAISLENFETSKGRSVKIRETTRDDYASIDLNDINIISDESSDDMEVELKEVDFGQEELSDNQSDGANDERNAALNLRNYGPAPVWFSLLLLLSVFNPGDSCANTHSMKSDMNKCTLNSTGHFSCDITGTISMNMPSVGYTGCVRFTGMENSNMELHEYKLKQVRMKCLKKIQYYTFQPDILCDYQDNCYGVGQCIDDNCERIYKGEADLSPFQQTPMLSEVTCSRLPGGLMNGCFRMVDRCGFSRVMLQNTNKKYLSVYSCSSWQAEALITISVHDSVNDRNESIILRPGTSQSVHGTTITWTGFSPPYLVMPPCFVKSSALGKFYTPQCNTKLDFSRFRIGEIQCPSDLSAREGLGSCLTQKGLVGNFGIDLSGCESRYTNLSSLLQKTSLPQSRDNYHLEVTNGEIYAVMNFIDPVDIRVEYVGYKTDVLISDLAYHVMSLSISGCYSCDSSVTVCVKIDKEPDLDYILITCGDKEFTIIRTSGSGDLTTCIETSLNSVVTESNCSHRQPNGKIQTVIAKVNLVDGYTLNIDREGSNYNWKKNSEAAENHYPKIISLITDILQDSWASIISFLEIFPYIKWMTLGFIIMILCLYLFFKCRQTSESYKSIPLVLIDRPRQESSEITQPSLQV